MNIDVVYVEDAVFDHPRTRAILARVRPRHVIGCSHWGEVFNRNGQNFRLQKTRPALILARKLGQRVLPIPPGYGCGAGGVYFSHMLNCLYDCRYCFLQGMLRSAHYVVFVNYEDFIDDLRSHCAAQSGPTWLFSGYDCDSLALDPLTAFVTDCVPALATIENAWLELRTKSTQVRALFALETQPRTVCAFSLSPAAVVAAYEHRTPALDARLRAMTGLAARGWPIGLRFDPVLPVADYRAIYGAFFAAVFAALATLSLHSVTFGVMRLPRDYRRRMTRLYPDEPLFASAALDDTPSAHALTQEIDAWCAAELARYVPRERLFAQAV